MLHGHRVGESVEATLCNLRELLDDVRRTQLETDPTKPKLDDQGKRGYLEDDAGDSWYDPKSQLDAKEQLAQLIGQEEAERTFGKDAEVFYYDESHQGPTVDELAAMVEANMASLEDASTGDQEEVKRLDGKDEEGIHFDLSAQRPTAHELAAMVKTKVNGY